MEAIGIDLGTTNSCVAVLVRNGRQVEIIANDQGNRIMPSYVAFNEEERLIGEGAKNQIAANAENTVFDSKRLIGRRLSDENIQKDIEHWPFRLFSDRGNPNIQVECRGEMMRYVPEEISAMVLEKLKKTAEDYLGRPVTEAVITVPAYFNDGQRRATISAGEIVGLKVLKILNEPTAAAIAYGFHKQIKLRNILVFDLGGGTFDISVMSLENGHYRVKAVAGDTHLGGEDFDNRLVEHFIKEFYRKYKKDVKKDKRALRRLKDACERAKKNLSNCANADIQIDALMEGQDYVTRISKARFEALNKDLFDRLVQHIENALADAGMKKEEIDDVVLVGGSSRIPKVQDLVKTFFDGKELNKQINPDEAVAYGAAIVAAKLSGDTSKEISRLQIHEVTPLSLGVGIKGDIMSTLIKRNTPIPVKRSGEYYTIEDNQTSININIYEGENVFTKDNHLLGHFTLDGIPPLPAGEAKVTKTFEINDNGILRVGCTDQQTGNEKSLEIKHDTGRFSEAQVAKMIQKANKNREHDEKRREIIQARNDLEIFANRIASLDHKDATRTSDEILEWIESPEANNVKNIRLKLSRYKHTWDPIIKRTR